MVKWDIACASCFCASHHFGAQKPSNVSIFSFWCRTDSWVNDKYGFLAFGKWSQDFCKLFCLFFGGRFHLTKVVTSHVLATHHHYHFGIGQNCGIVVNMIGQMADLCPRNTVKTRGFAVYRATQDRSRKDKERVFFLLFYSGLSFFVCPLRAFAISMPGIAIATCEGLTPIGKKPLMRFLPIVACPLLLSI